ncbi:FAD-dependent oxidoreductase, partial [Desulfovibrio desulfuricans]|nr:FAD-dependent oxidoreductase [Desulfovibrio desulfuricans]
RVQSDKLAYKQYMQQKVLQQPHLEVREMCVEQVLAEDGRVTGIRQKDGVVVNCRALIVTTGTFMSSSIL